MSVAYQILEELRTIRGLLQKPNSEEWIQRSVEFWDAVDEEEGER